MKYDIAAFQLQIVNVFSGNLVLLFHDFRNLTDYRVLVAFNSARHKTGIDDRIQIFLHHPSGNLGIHVDVLDGQSLHGVLITVLGCLQKRVPLLCRNLCILPLLLCLLNRQKNLTADRQPG